MPKRKTTVKFSRKTTTAGLHQAGREWLARYGFSVHAEVGLMRRGRLRGDLVGVRMDGTVCILEVKSGLADFTADKKMANYLDYCHKMYVCCTEEVCEKIRDRVHPDIGIMVLCTKGENLGYAVVRKPASAQETSGKRNRTLRENIQSLILRMCWRGGAWSKRNVKRRTRIQLED